MISNNVQGNVTALCLYLTRVLHMFGGEGCQSTYGKFLTHPVIVEHLRRLDLETSSENVQNKGLN